MTLMYDHEYVFMHLCILKAFWLLRYCGIFYVMNLFILTIELDFLG